MVFKRECWQTFKDLRRLSFLFGAALAYLLVFGMLYLPNIVKAIPCVIYDADNSKLSRQLITDFEDSDSFRIMGYVNTQEEMQEALRNKTAFVAIGIPADFSKKAKTGSYSTVLFMANGSNIIMTNVTSSAAQDIVASLSNALATRQTALQTGGNEGTLARRIAPVNVHLRVLYNSTQGYMFFFLIGLAMVAFQQGLFFAVGASVLYEYEHPDTISPQVKLVVKAIFYWCLAMISYLFVVLVTQEIMGIPLKAPLSTLLGLAAIFIFAATGFVMLFSTLFHTEVQFVRAIIMYPVPAFILSGYTWPTESMGAGMQFLAQFFPLSYFSNVVRELFLAGGSPHYAASIQGLAIIGMVCFLGAMWTFPHGCRRNAVEK
jgi:ABC-2 type transport system permease protein